MSRWKDGMIERKDNGWKEKNGRWIDSGWIGGERMDRKQRKGSHPTHPRVGSILQELST